MAKRNEKEDKIERPHLIICEGLDAKLYMIWFLEALIRDSIIKDKMFQAMDAGGITNLPIFIKTLPNLPNFDDIVKSIIIVRDSENNFKGANQSVQALLRKGGFAVPVEPCVVARPDENDRNIKTGYALFPKLDADSTNGTLEDLCLNTLIDQNKDMLMGIVEKAIESHSERFDKFKRPHKNKLHTFLSLTDKFVGLKIGESAKINAFDFQSEDVRPLKELLCAMLTD